uniref:Uncharacterized protein n=1 Tax=Arundo donax TaxID=35708 RepID=A0A0A8Y1S4_ARUDO
MAERRIQGLCFNCPEKFSRDHIKQSTTKGIYLMEIDETIYNAVSNISSSNSVTQYIQKHRRVITHK